jgi:hypothetical protein
MISFMVRRVPAMFRFFPIHNAARLFRLVRLVRASLFQALGQHVLGHCLTALLSQREELGTADALGGSHSHFTFFLLVPGFPSQA